MCEKNAARMRRRHATVPAGRSVTRHQVDAHSSAALGSAADPHVPRVTTRLETPRRQTPMRAGVACATRIAAAAAACMRKNEQKVGMPAARA